MGAIVAGIRDIETPYASTAAAARGEIAEGRTAAARWA
jgi:hypothetical protein